MRTKFFILLAVFGLASSAMLVTAARPAGRNNHGKSDVHRHASQDEAD